MADSVQVFQPGYFVADALGNPVSGAQIVFTNAGSPNDPYEVFADIDLTVSLGSVVYVDSAGRPVTTNGGSTQTLVYVGTTAYRVEIRNSLGVTIAGPYDNVRAAVAGGEGGDGGSGITQAQADVRYVRNPNALAYESSLTDADLFAFWDTSASINKNINWLDVKDRLVAESVVFAAGTTTVFYQASAPTGWTKLITANLDNAACRIVTGSGGVTGGTSNFSTVFASRTITLANIPSYTLPDSLALSGSQTGGLVRELTNALSGSPYGTPNSNRDRSWFTTTLSLTGAVTSGGSGAAMDFNVKYADFIVCEKD
jgi:hypothetical protein